MKPIKVKNVEILGKIIGVKECVTKKKSTSSY